MMNAIEITAFGGPDMLRPVRRPVPVPGAGQVLIHVAAAGVNRPDVLQRKGHHPPPPGASDLPGLEVAGEVIGVGPGVRRWKAGDRVTALLPGGGYAQYALADEGSALPVPQGLSMIEAAALPETVLTVWHNVFERGALQPGETLLVHGGTSGIGTAAIQIAHGLGARVLATAGSAEKCAACTRLGADRAINYRTEDFVEAVREETQGRGADVILDMVGGDYTARNIGIAAEDGRIVQIAFLHGPKVGISLAPILMKRLTLTGSTLRHRSPEIKAAIARAVEATVWPLLETSRMRPVIDSVFPLEEAAKAHERMESGLHIGKIMLTAG